LYPGKHILEVDNNLETNVYTVNLTLSL
jgi:hypothetical protein